VNAEYSSHDERPDDNPEYEKTGDVSDAAVEDEENDLQDKLNELNDDVENVEDSSPSGFPPHASRQGFMDYPDEVLDSYDSHLSSAEKEKRLSDCIMATRKKIIENDSELQRSVQAIVEQRKMDANQAVNAIAHEMLVRCYFKMEVKDVGALLNKNPKELSKVFEASTPTPLRLSKTQGEILGKIMKAERRAAHQQQYQQGHREGPSLGGINMSEWSDTTKAFWIMGVMTVLFGSAIWTIQRLMKTEDKVKKKSSKSAKKEERMARANEKKML